VAINPGCILEPHWGALNWKKSCPRPIPCQLNQNLSEWASGIGIFKLLKAENQ
jgi:hypothetical protein